LNTETAKGTFIGEVNFETVIVALNQYPRLRGIEHFFVAEWAY